MDDYQIILSKEAKKDIDNLTEVIKNEYKAPFTAFKYVQELLDEILSLSKFPKIYAEKFYPAFLHYGSVRRINYKRMAIIYTVDEQTVYIHRIMPASMILDE